MSDTLEHVYKYLMDTSSLSLSSHTLTTAEVRGCLVIQVAGELDMLTRDHLHRAGSDLLRTAGAPLDTTELHASPGTGLLDPSPIPQARNCVVDLREVPFMDCAGLGGLLALLNAAACEGHRVALVASQPTVVLVLRLAGLEDTHPLVSDVITAQRLLDRGKTT